MLNKELPLSPHLQIYKAQMTSAMSIFHRMTGAFLAAGICMLVWMLLAAASGPDAYATFATISDMLVFKAIYSAWAAALFYHMFNGVRHLLWDMGYLFKLKNAFTAGYIVLLLTLASTGCFVWNMFF